MCINKEYLDSSAKALYSIAIFLHFENVDSYSSKLNGRGILEFWVEG